MGDASVMPYIVNANTNFPSIMIGEKCAEFLRTLTGASVSFVTFHVSRPSQKVVSRAHYDRGGGAVEHVAYVTERCDLRSEA